MDFATKTELRNSIRAKKRAMTEEEIVSRIFSRFCVGK